MTNLQEQIEIQSRISRVSNVPYIVEQIVEQHIKYCAQNKVCPICGEPLRGNVSGYLCKNGHSF